MATTNFNQEFWSNLILKGTQSKIAFFDCVNNIGTVNGKTVHFAGISDITVSNYVKETAISSQNVTDTGIDLDLNVQKYFSCAVEDLDKAQTDVNLASEIVRKATNALKKEIETNIASRYSDADITTDLGNDTTAITLTADNILSYIRKMGRLLNEADCEEKGRWLVISPWVYELLSEAIPEIDTNNSEMLRSGYIGYFQGFNISWSNNIDHAENNTFTHIMAGTRDSIRFGMNVNEIESLRNPDQFGDIVRGLMCFNSVKTGKLACLTASPA